jgi:uncharacterized 2Fe-2S/4Fe-4S cluster protein (DUF4445 family)
VPKVTFLPSGQVCSVDVGATVLDVSRENDVGLSNCCSGRAICTTCRVSVEAGLENLSEIGEREFDMLELLHVSSALRLGCQARVLGDVVVRIPD